MAAFIKTPNSLIFQFAGGITKRLPVESEAGKAALSMLKAGASDADILVEVDILESIKKHTSGKFNIDKSGNVLVGTDKLPQVLGNRLLDFADAGLLGQADALINFWNNCKQNPDKRAQTDLYGFLEHNGIPITPDGCFVAYRSVKRNADGKLVDCHTGTFVNEPGEIVSMPREQVDSNPNQTCSNGLHVAAIEYAKGFGQVLLNVKVNPRDVCAIPTDYNRQKMRVCRFEVLEINAETATDGTELTGPLYGAGTDQDGTEDSLFEDKSDEDLGNDDEEVDGLIRASTPVYKRPDGVTQVRGPGGRFGKKVV